jgi:hypothetical protein
MGRQDETDADRAKTIERGIAVIFVLASTHAASV